MMGHKINFNVEIWITIPKLSLLPLLIWSTGINKIINNSETLCQVVQEYGYINIFQHSTKGDNLCDFLFASLDIIALPNLSQLLKERISSLRGKFFPLTVDHYGDGRQKLK